MCYNRKEVRKLKKLLTVILICALMSFLFVGCFVAPEEGEVGPVVGIVCEGGHYEMFYAEWSLTGCEDDPWYPAGTYWVNDDGRIFLLGECVDSEIVHEIYGLCPTGYLEEIFF